MMTNLLHGAHVANKLFSTIARLRLLLVMFLTLTVSAEVWGATITFKTNASDNNTALTASNFEEQVTAGADFISSVSNLSRVYAGKNGLKFGASSNVGYVTINLETSAQITNPKITIKSAKYSDDTGKFNIYINGSSTASEQATPGTDLIFTYTGKITSIKIATTTKRAYLSSIIIEESSAPSHTITATSNNDSYGTVALQGTTITATPKIGYRVSTTTPYTISPPEAAKVTQSENKFTVTPTANCTITINFEALPKYTVTLNAGPGTCAASVTEASAGEGVTLPTPTLDCGNWEFAGWKTTSAVTTETTTEPTLIPAGAYSPTSDITLYAVYQRTDGGGGGSTPTEVSKTYTFSDYEEGEQYAEETYELDDDVTINITGCHINTQLRVYGAQPGIVISEELPGRIVSMGFNMGYKADALVVYGSTDGSLWTEVGSISTTTSYKDYTLDFGETNYTYFKLNVEGSSQIRIAKMSITYESTSGGGSSSTTYYHSTPECNTETTVYLIPKCWCDGGTWLVVIEWFATF